MSYSSSPTFKYQSGLDRGDVSKVPILPIASELSHLRTVLLPAEHTVGVTSKVAAWKFPKGVCKSCHVVWGGLRIPKKETLHARLASLQPLLRRLV